MSFDFDTSAILRAYLLTTPVVSEVSTRIYTPRAPQNAELPNIVFFQRGGGSNPHMPDLPNPSKQFDCWANSLVVARKVYRVLYDSLQGIQNVPITFGGKDYVILSAIEEVHGQDRLDVEIPNLFHVLSFWSIQVK